MTTTNHNFARFEFDAALLALWQQVGTPNVKTFAYQQKLHTIIAQSSLPWQANLESLKLLDVFLSAVKSDLASKHIKEAQALGHDEFIKMLVLLAFHVVQVLQSELAKVAGNTELYSAQGFNRLYARAFLGLVSEFVPDTENLDAFYQGLVVLGSNPKSTQSLFVLAVIGARLFGSIERAIVGLDSAGKPKAHGEDSLYWAVSDFLRAMQGAANRHDTSFVPSLQTLDKSINTTKTQDSPAAPNPASNPIFGQLEQTYLAPDSDAPTKKAARAPINVKTSPQPSAYKQRAYASHTPKLFVEAYQDLLTMPLPSDTQRTYQQAQDVLNQFDKHINEELAKGKSLTQITFSEQQKLARKNALQQLVALVQQSNHPSAMLRLALYCFEGRGMAQNTAKALMLTEQAAKMGDARAQKLLSRLYYQGFDADNGGVMRNQELGDMWLNKSAQNGHSEAQKLVAYMQQVQVLKEDYRSEQQSDKRYGLFFLALIVGTLLLVVMMNLIW